MFPISRNVWSRNVFLQCLRNISTHKKISSSDAIFQRNSKCACAKFPTNKQFIRFKTTRGSKIPQQPVTETESEEIEDFDDVPDKHAKVLKLNIPSLRVDSILKSALGVSRNKIDVMFYENRFRLNGEKILKKSATASEGDEIDLIKNVSATNPEYLIVARVEVLSSVVKEENLSVSVRRYKSLTIENYSGNNTWKG